MVPADSGRVPRARPYSGTTAERTESVTYGTFTRCGAPFQAASIRGLQLPVEQVREPPHDPARCPGRFRLFPVRSPLLGESRLLSVPPGTEMFQFPGLSQVSRDRSVFGHSPELIAAFHACTAGDA